MPCARRLGRSITALTVALACIVAATSSHAAMTQAQPPARAARGWARIEFMRRLADPRLRPDERVRLIRERLDAVRATAVIAPASASPATGTLDAPVGDCTQWSEWSPNTDVLARSAHTLIYDATGDRLVLFGGSDDQGNLPNDVWTLNLTGTPAWTLLATAGTPPDGRMDATAIYDVTRNRMIVYGGWSGDLSNVDHVYALSLGGTPTWSDISPAGPAPPSRAQHAAIYDGTRDRMVVFGGYDPTGSGSFWNDAWALSLAPGGGWTNLTPAGTAPFPRTLARAIYDSPRDRMLVFGGNVDDGQTLALTHETWSLSFSGGGAWSRLSPGGTPPPALAGHTAVFDSPRNRMIVYGGAYDIGNGDFWAANDLWSLSLTGSTSWSHLSPSGSLPAPVQAHAAAYDAAHQRMRVFGGIGAGGDETWSLILSGSPAWTGLDVAGAAPRARVGHSMIVDRAGQRVVVFGGFGWNGILGDVWTHSLVGPGGWTRILPGGTGPVRANHSAVYDSVGDRMIVFGGDDDKTHENSDAWALSLGGTPAWTRLSPAGVPPGPRAQTSADYDRARRRMLVWGGSDSVTNAIDELWALNLAGSGTWSAVSAGGEVPTLVEPSPGVYESQSDEFVVIGPIDESWAAHVWRLPLAAGGSWTHTEPGADTPSITEPGSVFDPGRNRVIVGDRWSRVYALSLSGTPSWRRYGVPGTPPPDIGGRAAAFDQVNDHVLTMGGQGLNTLSAMSVLTGTHSLSARAVPDYGGSVFASPPDECLTDGTQVTVTATAAAGYSFAGWGGDASGTTNPLTVTIDASKTIVANFEPPPASCDQWRRLGFTTDVLPLDAPVMVRDATAGRLIAMGSNSGPHVDQTWQLPLASAADWQQLGTVGATPHGITLGSAVYDPVRNRVLEYAMGGVDLGVLRELRLTGTPTWSVVATGGSPPPTRWYGSIVYDSARDRLLLFGGVTDYYAPDAPDNYRNDVWALSLSGTPTWSEISPVGSAPDPRFGHLAFYDPVRDRMLVVRGTRYPVSPANDVWALSLAGAPAWSQVQTIAAGDPFATGGVYDPVRDRLVFAAWPTTLDDNTPESVTALSLKYGAAWLSFASGGNGPPKLQDPAMAYDPAGDRMILTGGFKFYGGAYTSLHETYEFNFGSGAWLDVYATPAAWGSVARSPADDCHTPGTVVTLTPNPQPGYVFDHWTGDATGNANPLRVTVNANMVVGAVFVDQPVATEIARFEAERGADGVRLAWSLAPGTDARGVSVERAESETGPWTAIAAPVQAGGGGYTALDPDAGPDRTWYFRLSAPLATGATVHSAVVRVAAASVVARTELALVAPNPSGTVRIEFTLAHQGPVRLSVLDVAGREVAVLAQGVHPVGRYTAAFGRGSAAHAAAPGVYFLRFATPGHSETRRIAIVD